MEAIQVSLNRWTDQQMWYIHTMEYYSALKRKEILQYATTWMNFRGIMPSEMSQSQKDKCSMISLIWDTWTASKEMGSPVILPQGTEFCHNHMSLKEDFSSTWKDSSDNTWIFILVKDFYPIEMKIHVHTKTCPQVF